jgi:hypothetical protein
MKLNDNQLMILSAAGVTKSGALLAEIAGKVAIANPKRACEALVKRGLMKPIELKLTNQIGKGAGYALTDAGENEIGIEDARPQTTEKFLEGCRDRLAEELEPPAAGTDKPAKPAAPREGTRARGIFDILKRKGGATNAECRATDLGDVSLKHHATRFADRYGLTVNRVKEGRGERVSLT